jgi:hypothetical protein
VTIVFRLSPDGRASGPESVIVAGVKTRWQLRDFCHTLSEWQDPEGGAIAIEYHDILHAAGKTQAEIAAVEQELDTLALADALMAPV